MLLTEADGKAQFAAHGIAIPRAREIAQVEEITEATLPGAGPWIVKAQLPAGGRGKAGFIRRVADAAAARDAAAAMLGTRLKGHTIETCLIEEAVAGQEHYLALMLDAASYGVRVIYLAAGGVEVEQAGQALGILAAPEQDAIAAALATATAGLDPAIAAPIRATGAAMARLLLDRELMLVEVNPLFVSPRGAVAGDAKIVADLSAVPRQPALFRLIEARPNVYADANRKLAEGFDYVELDPDGTLGLVTTGAGLSMMLIDELARDGIRPLNFCDIRTGQFRGSPARLIRVLGWIAEHPSVRVVLVNIFAGITDLGEFAALLDQALAATPQLRVPIVARLVGRGVDAARSLLTARRPDMCVTEDLTEALAAVRAIITKGAA